MKEQVSSGIAWTAVGRVLQQVIQFSLSVLLARLLSPEDYGLMAMVMVATGFAGVLADIGFGTALVQRREVTQAHIDSVFWLTFALGLLLTAVVYFSASQLANFFDAVQLIPVFQTIAVNFTVASLGSVPFALLQKRMQFKVISNIGTCAVLISGVVAIVLAFRGAGVWSLVAQTLTSSVLITALRFFHCKWRIRCSFSFLAIRDMWAFTVPFYGANIVNYWSRSADNLLIGKFLSATELGVYTRAYGLMMLPITKITDVIEQVFFPVFSSIQHDSCRVKSVFLRMISVAAFLTFPITFGLCATAEPFILTVYGPKWSGVIPILQILALVSALQVMANFSAWLILKSKGRSDLLFRWVSCFAGFTVISFCVGISIGSTKAVALCYAAVNAIVFFPAIRLIGKTIGITVREFLCAVAGSFAVAVVMTILIALATYLLRGGTWAPWKQLLILVPIGAVTYLGCAFVSQLDALRQLRHVLKRDSAGLVQNQSQSSEAAAVSYCAESKS